MFVNIQEPQVRYSTRVVPCGIPDLGLLDVDKHLGSVLFLVYVNDLPCSISSDCSIFADDTSVYNTGSKPPSICSMLSKDLNYAADWAAEWGMLLNAEKSEHLTISTRKSDITSPHVTMNGTQIPQVTSHKHLGVNFNNTLPGNNMSTKFTRPVLEE